MEATPIQVALMLLARTLYIALSRPLPVFLLRSFLFGLTTLPARLWTIATHNEVEADSFAVVTECGAVGKMILTRVTL